MPEKLPETGAFYADQKGELYHCDGTVRHWQTMEELVIVRETKEGTMYAVPVPDFTKEFQKAGQSDTKGLLLGFLEADSIEEKLSILQKNHSEIMEEFLDAAAQSMDYALNGKEMEMKFLDFEKYLRTKMKYERRR